MSATTPGIEDFTLPSEPSEPETDLGAYSILIYGEKKIGKTSLAAQFPDTIFLMTEPGGKALRIYQRHVTSWLMFQKFVELVCQSEDFKTVVVDTVDIAYDLCLRHVCARLGIDDPGGQDDYGASWRAVRSEFNYWITRLLSSGKGVVMLSHTSHAEVTSRMGRKFTRIQSSMAKQPREVLDAVVDIWGYYHYGRDDERWLQIEGDELVSAGRRNDDQFLTPSGERVRLIPMGGSKEEAYANFVRAWNNEQQYAEGRPKTKSKSKAKARAKAKRRS